MKNANHLNLNLVKLAGSIVKQYFGDFPEEPYLEIIKADETVVRAPASESGN